MRMLYFLMIVGFAPLFGDTSYYYKNGEKVPLKKIVQNQTDSQIPLVIYYQTPKKQIVGVGDEIILKVTNRVFLEALAVKYHFEIVESVGLETYLIRTGSKEETLEISNNLQLEFGVVYSEPNFLRVIQKR